MTPTTAKITLTEALYPSEIKIACKVAFRARRRPMVHGAPGIGKSQVMEQIADELFATKYGLRIDPHGKVFDPTSGRYLSTYQKPYYLEIRTPQYDAVDLRGLCDISGSNDAKKTVWVRPAELPTSELGGLIFADEINRGNTMVGNALFQLRDQNRIGPHHVPETWCMAAAVNDADIGVNKMPDALKLRFGHYDMIPCLPDVLDFALKNGWDDSVVAFLRFRYANNVSTGGSDNILQAFISGSRAGCNPRSWGYVSQLMLEGDRDYAHLTSARKSNFLMAQVASHVGEPAAVEYIGFRKLYTELPSIDSIVTSPGTAIVPTKPGLLFAIAGALSKRATPQNFKNILTYLERVPVEFNILCVKDTVKRTPALGASGMFTTWANKHADVTF